MTFLAETPHPLIRTARKVAPRALLLVALAVVFGAGAVVVENPHHSAVAMAVALTFVTLAVLVRGLAWGDARAARVRLRAVAELVEHDATPCFGTDAEGRIEFRNHAAVGRYGVSGDNSLARAMADVFVSPTAVFYRLQRRAASAGAAREDVVTRQGHLRLSVHRTDPERYLWRLEDLADRNGSSRGAEVISLPMLIASKSGTVLFMNDALRRILGARPKSLDRVFASLPLHGGAEVDLLGAEGHVRVFATEIPGPGDRREIYLWPKSFGAADPVPDPVGFEELPVALARLAPDGRLGAANRLARDLLGLTPGEQPVFSDLVQGLGRPVADWLADAEAGRIASRPEMLRATRRPQDTFLQIGLRRTAQPGSPGLIAVLSDATEFKTLEAQFVQSQKMQAIGQLAGGVAHDFNNLLTAISGHCDLLLLRHRKDDPDYADLVQIHQNANRAASLISQLLAFSRKQTLTPERINLQETLSDLTHLLNRLVGAQVQLKLVHGKDVGVIRADKRQLEQVLMNLVVNARDAMPNGGTIHVETESRHLTEPLQRDRAVVPPGDYVVVQVRDEGVGIPADRLTKVFEPFFTTKRSGEGTGLGLSTVYGIIKQSGGFIFIDSVVGTGTTFSLFFPAHPEAEPAAATPAPARAARPALRQGGGVILLVEDEAPVRAFASRALRLRGYTVLEAENAEQALKTLTDPELTVDVFVTDVVMPGMDGPSWVSEALKKRPGVRVIFVSGYAEESFVETQARIPNSVFLPKPFSLTDLTATVQGQIH